MKIARNTKGMNGHTWAKKVAKRRSRRAARQALRRGDVDRASHNRVVLTAGSFLRTH